MISFLQFSFSWIYLPNDGLCSGRLVCAMAVGACILDERETCLELSFLFLRNCDFSLTHEEIAMKANMLPFKRRSKKVSGGL